MEYVDVMPDIRSAVFLDRQPEAATQRLRSVFSCEGFYGGEGALEEFIPVRDLGEAAELEVVVCRGRADCMAQLAEAALAFVEVRFDAVAEVAGSQSAQAGFGGEMSLPHAGDIDDLDGADVSQPAQPLVRRPAAHVQSLREVVEGGRILRAEEQSVNLPDRSRYGKARRRVDKEIHAFLLEAIQKVRAVGCGDRLCLDHSKDFWRKLPPLVKNRIFPNANAKM